METGNAGVAICFTQGHGEKLVIEEVQHEGLVDMLFRSEYLLGKIETWVTWQKLVDYQVLVIGAPQEDEFHEVEIKAIIEFVKDGGSLFLISDEGADVAAKSNLNDISREFGFTFKPNIIIDPDNHVKKPEYVIVDNFERHFITRDVREIIFASGCSIDVQDPGVLVLAKTSESALQKTYLGGDEGWSEPFPAPSEPIIVMQRYGKGKVVAIGNFSIITSLSRTYGLFAADNVALVGNIFAWLSNRKLDDEKANKVYLNIAIDADLYFWIERELKSGRFKGVNELVEFSLSAVKESLSEIENTPDTDEYQGDDDETGGYLVDSGDEPAGPGDDDDPGDKEGEDRPES